MSEFTVGQWVVIMEHSYEGCLGYITSCSQERAWVKIVKNTKGKVIKNKVSYLFKPEEMAPADLENMDGCLYTLIDLALSTRDFEWLQQLSKEEQG